MASGHVNPTPSGFWKINLHLTVNLFDVSVKELFIGEKCGSQCIFTVLLPSVMELSNEDQISYFSSSSVNNFKVVFLMPKKKYQQKYLRYKY